VSHHLAHLLTRVPAEIRPEETKQVGIFYSAAFTASCEVLLALLRLRGHPAAACLRAGSSAAGYLAKAIRQLDSRFSRAKLDLPWTRNVELSPPPDLASMSPVAYALNVYLAGTKDLNYVSIADSPRGLHGA